MNSWYDEAVLDEPTVLTPSVMAAAFPQCDDPDAWLDVLAHHMSLSGIDEPRYMAMFLAHLGHESGDLMSLEENFNYSVVALLQLFGRHRITEEEANAFGRGNGHPANQEHLANILYGGEWGLENLGNEVYGDGWKHRGQGPIQLTGKYNHRICGEDIGVDLVADPGLLVRDPEIGVMSALWYWDKHVSGHDMKTTTYQINRGYNGLEDRQARYRRIFDALGGRS